MKTIVPAAPGQGNLLPVSGAYLLEHRDLLEKQEVPVYQVLRSPGGEFRADRFDLAGLGQIPPADRDRLSYLVDRQWKAKIFSALDRFEAQLEPLRALSAEKRVEAAQNLKAKLAGLKAEKAEPAVQANAIMDVVGDAFLLNKASLKLKPLEVGVNERAVAGHTESIVAYACEMAEQPEVAAALLAGFQDLSNGQTVNHVLRVFRTYTGFLRYYNEQHRHSLAGVVRQLFGSHYKERYRRMLPGLDERLMTSDNLLQLSQFSAEDLKELSLGAFLHDIGKLGNIDYFESDAAYDVKQIQQHVFLGSGLILRNYSNDHNGARLLAADHHNYLGHPSGYGVTRRERETGLRPAAPLTRVLASEPLGFVSGAALGWLPTEMLAVADVYDAMVDDSRAYKKAMTPGEAAVFLEDKMAADGKLDPVLVDLYVDYLRGEGLEMPEGRGLLPKTRQH